MPDTTVLAASGQSVSVATHLRTTIVVCAIVVTGLFWGLYANDVRIDRDIAYENARTNLSNLNRLFAEHTARTINSIDDLALLVRGRYLEDGTQTDLEQLLRLVGRQNEFSKLINLVAVTDE